MTEKTRKQVLDLLETAHGYALAGSYMPFRTAVVECKPTEDVKDIAYAAITTCMRACNIPDGEKPDAKVYAECIAQAIARYE